MKKIIMLLLGLSLFQMSFSSMEKAIEYNKVGERYYHEKNYDKAKKYFIKAWMEDRSYSQAASNLGLVYMKEGDLDASLYWDEEAIITTNDNVMIANSSYSLGRAFEAKELYFMAFKYYVQANEANPKKTYEQAIDRILDKISNLKVDKQLAKDLNLAGLREYKKKNYKEAIELFKESLKANELDGQTWSNLGISYLKVDNFYASQMANIIALIITENNTTKANSYYGLGKLYERNGQLEVAYSSYLNANKYNPKESYEEAIERINSRLLNR